MNAPVKTLRKLPIGIQSFEFLRSEGYLYVDKTELVYRLVTKGKPYFLSRPRRFGNSSRCSRPVWRRPASGGSARFPCAL